MCYSTVIHCKVVSRRPKLGIRATRWVFYSLRNPRNLDLHFDNIWLYLLLWNCWWKYMWMSGDIFGLRIVMINGCWNFNVFIAMEVLVKIYVNGLWYIWIKNCDNKWMLLKLECIDGYRILGKNICEWVMIYLDWELWW
jgi:hypothetical protein